MKDKPSDEFRNFDDAMTRLLSVSYEDLKERIEEDKRAKAAERKRRSTSSTSRASSSRKKRAS